MAQCSLTFETWHIKVFRVVGEACIRMSYATVHPIVVVSEVKLTSLMIILAFSVRWTSKRFIELHDMIVELR